MSILRTLLSQADTVTILSNNPNYAAIQALKPSWYIKAALNLLLGAAGVASFVFLLMGGIQWIMAGGDKDALDKARKRIVQALVGLTIVFSSYVILYIIRALFNVNLIEFCLTNIGGICGSGPSSGPGPVPVPGPGPVLLDVL